MNDHSGQRRRLVATLGAAVLGLGVVVSVPTGVVADEPTPDPIDVRPVVGASRWDFFAGNAMEYTRGLLLNPSNFGVGGIVDRPIVIHQPVAPHNVQPADLDGMDVVVGTLVTDWTSDSLDNVEAFVRAGGGFIATEEAPSSDQASEHFGLTAQPLLVPAGATDETAVVGTVLPPGTHPVVNGPFGPTTTFKQYATVTWYTDLGPHAESLAVNNAYLYQPSPPPPDPSLEGDAIAVINPDVLDPGSGPVVFVSDTDTFSKAYGPSSTPGAWVGGAVTNPELVLNTFAWAATAEAADITEPVFTGPATQQLEGNTTDGYTGYDLTAAGLSVTDDVDAAADLVMGNDAPDPLPLGLTTVRWTASDLSSNQGTFDQDVTVVDTTPPAITCPADVTVASYGLPVVLGSPTGVSDVVDAAPVVANDAPAVFGTGSTPVTWTATDASTNQGSCVQTVTVTAAATTSLLYNGQQIVAQGAAALLGAKLGSSIASCVSGQPVEFRVSPNPATPGDAGSSLALGTDSTDSSGQALLSQSTAGWPGGAYEVSVLYAGTANCAAASDVATLVVSTAGDAANGGGWYTASGAGRSNFGFTVKKVSAGVYRGQALLVNNGKWRLKGALTSYAKSGTTGSASGTGTLYYWNTVAGAWVVSQLNTPFVFTFADNGSGKKVTADTFGVTVNHKVVSPEPGTLPNTKPVAIKGGNITVA